MFKIYSFRFPSLLVSSERDRVGSADAARGRAEAEPNIAQIVQLNWKTKIITEGLFEHFLYSSYLNQVLC